MTTKKVLPKTIFWGTPDFSLSALAACFENSELLAVVSQPDKPKGRGFEVLPTPVKSWAIEKKLKVFSPKSLRKLDTEGEELMAFLKANVVDYFVVVAYGNLLPQAVLELPKLAPVNVHASLLPRWRGAAPIQRALEAGDRQTGVSLQRMVSALDAGAVLFEKKYSIKDEDNAKTLFTQLSHLGGALVQEFLQRDFASLTPRPQDSTLVTLAPKISKDEAEWNSAWSAAEFLNRVRAFVVWPTVRLVFSKKAEKIEVKILESKISPKTFAKSWGSENNSAFLKCADAFVLIEKAQVPGKSPARGDQIFQKLQADGFDL